MVTYRVYQKQLSDTLQAQFIYENSPVFAGTDDFSVLVRLKYTGDVAKKEKKPQLNDPFGNQEHQRLENKDDENVQVHSTNDSKETTIESSSWFGNRFSTQLSNATRSLFLQSLNPQDSIHGRAEPNKPKETLILGYCQVLGHYSINDTIIDYSIFKDLQASTIIEGKYAGIQGLSVPSEQDDEGTGIFAGLNHLYNTELNSFTHSNINDKMRFIPFYSSKQNIIFSELEVDPELAGNQEGEIKSFFITCKLPKNLPPTYMTESILINYNFIFGYQLLNGGNVQSKTVFVPLKIQPFVDNHGRQPIHHLEKAVLNASLENFAVHDVTNHPSLAMRHPSTTNINNDSRRISFWNLRKNSTIKDTGLPINSPSTFNSLRRKKSSIVELSSIAKLDEDVIVFLDTLDRLDSADINDIVKVQEEFEKEQNQSRSFKYDVRENLMQILTDSRFVQKRKLAEDTLDEDIEYECLLPKDQQTKYIIKQNHDAIATIYLNKGVFKLGDSINLHISFDQEEYTTAGVELQLLKQQVFQREEYLKKGTYDEISPRIQNNTLETILFQKMTSTIGAISMNSDILVPLETEPQFKTNFFTSKYYVQVRFITNGQHVKKDSKVNDDENNDMDSTVVHRSVNFFDNIFIDSSGSVLLRSKERIGNANEFYIRIPVVILPTYEQDFGIMTTKT